MYLPLLHAGQAKQTQGLAHFGAIGGRFPVPAPEMRMPAGQRRLQHAGTERVLLELPEPATLQGGSTRAELRIRRPGQ